MTIPNFDQFIEPILRFLVQHPDGVLGKQAHDAAATALGLTCEQRQQFVPGRKQKVYRERAAWAYQSLKGAGLSDSPTHGFWKPTAAGVAFAAEHIAPFSAELVQMLKKSSRKVKLKIPPNASGQLADSLPHLSLPVATVASPDNQLREAVAELRRSAASELLEVLTSVSPSFFNTIVFDLLHRMGYGATRSDLQQVGGSGDAGIDSIISLDPLGLEKLYVKAKRWQEVIEKPQLQAFYGALACQKAKKGIFITTSFFSAQARDFVKSIEDVALIDGVRLAELMIEYEVGIQVQTIKIPRVDTNYFDEDVT